MPNDISKLHRIMRTSHVLQKGDEDHKFARSLALKQAWWFESFRDALSNGFARFTYYKKDGTIRTALGTRAASLIPLDKMPKGDMSDGAALWENNAEKINYFDLDKNEWRSFKVLNFVKLEQAWRFNDPLA